MSQTIKELTKRNLEVAFKRLKKDTKGFKTLIVRDPLDYIDFVVNLDANLDSIIYEIKTNLYHPQKPFLLPSAKSKGINRPTVVFDIKDALVYRFCIEQIEDEIIKKTRQKNIRGGIKITPNKKQGGDDFYEKWFEDWMQHQEDLRESLQRKNHLVSTDIASYFENINLLVLKDLLRSDVSGKQGILNLLFYFLENTRFRNYYEVNTFNGLPQEDIDCSRLLAYYFLKANDDAMATFCKLNDAEFYRFVDDMAIAVDSEVVGKRALKTMTESLRSLNLVSSIEKTSIIDSRSAEEQLFFAENDYLNSIQKKLDDKIEKNAEIRDEIKMLKNYYNALINAKKHEYKNWIKVLRRFYTLFTLAKSNFFLSKLKKHVIDFPSLFKVDKIGKYLVVNRHREYFNEAIESLLDYLYSEENLYPALETTILELFLLFSQHDLNKDIKNKLSILCNDIFLKKSGYSPLSDYARALACLMFFRFDKSNVPKIAKHYISGEEKNELLKKHIIFVSLTVGNDTLRKKVLNKAKTEQSISINRLINFVENIDRYRYLPVVKDYTKNHKMFIHETKKKFKIIENVTPVRNEILHELISIYGSST
jgi:hypothetical protein